VGGTIRHTGALSVMLIFGLVVVFSFYLKNQLSYKKFLIIAFLLFIPTTINETKVTFFLLPVGIILPIFLLNNKNLLLRIKKIFSYSIFTFILLTIFVSAYDMLYGQFHGRTFIGYLIKEKEGRGYVLPSEMGTKKITEDTEIGRIDAIILAYKYLSENQIKIFFGTGIGTVKPKKLKFLETDNLNLTKYNPEASTASILIWEMGILGLFSFYLLIFFVFKDACSITNQNNFDGALALGWASVCLITIPVTLYINSFYIDVFNILFWFLSGIVVSAKFKKIHG
jgi:hypothetical protein